MKKHILSILILLVLIAFVCCFSACDAGAGDTQNAQEQPDDTSNSQDQSGDDNNEGINKMYITIYGNKLEVELYKNSSVDALLDILKSGNITYTADDYGNFEKVGNIGHSLPRNDTQITTQAGDVILYQGNSICLHYGANSWSYTRIGRINGYSASELRNLLGAGKGQMQVIISLT